MARVRALVVLAGGCLGGLTGTLSAQVVVKTAAPTAPVVSLPAFATPVSPSAPMLVLPMSAPGVLPAPISALAPIPRLFIAAAARGTGVGEVPAVSVAPTWAFDAAKGLAVPESFAGPAPGCVIAQAAAGTKFPKVLEAKGATYHHLRNGFYIGAHATDRDIAGLFEALAPDYERREISVPFNVKVYTGLAGLAARAHHGPEVGAVLDFGSGTGLGASALRRAFPDATLHGFDLSPAMRELSEKRGFNAVGETAGRLQLPDASMDLAVGAFVLHLVRSPDWIRELGRVLKPGAIAAFNVYQPQTGWRECYRQWFADAGFEPVELRAPEDRALSSSIPMPVVIFRKTPAAGL